MALPTPNPVLDKLLQSQPKVDEYVRFLIYGQSGTGKTYSLRTARKPLFVDSFDPGGSIVLSDLVQSGDAIVQTVFEAEDPKSPTAFAEWEKRISYLIQHNVMDNIGTYVIDSATTWGQAALNLVMAKAGRAGGTPQQNDWYPQMNLMEVGIRRIFKFPCDVVFICHNDTLKDDVIGKITRAPMLTGKSKTRIPLLFSEIYYADVRRSSKGAEYVWQLQADTTNMAKSRLCGLSKARIDFHIQDFSKLMREVSHDYEDKPRLVRSTEQASANSDQNLEQDTQNQATVQE